LKLRKAQLLADDLAEYFVYYSGDKENYVSLINQLRNSKTRISIMRALYSLLDDGDLSVPGHLENISVESLNALFEFIREADGNEVIQFLHNLTVCISKYELKRIREQEKYLLELLNAPLLEDRIDRGDESESREANCSRG
jgi:hypothetical protein